MACKDAAVRRVMSMPYPPPALLPIPSGFAPLPTAIPSLQLQDLELMTPEEEESNQQLLHTVWTAGLMWLHYKLWR